MASFSVSGLCSWQAGSASAKTLSEPSEAATLMSKEYGHERLAKVRKAIRQARLDALLVSNRSLDYISYVTNFHPFPLEPGVAFIPADGSTVLFVNTYSSAHTRGLRAMVWTDELVDPPRDPVSETSDQNLFDACVAEIRKRKLQRGRIGVAGGELDWVLPLYFHEKLPELRVQDASHTLTKLIVVKDPVELALIRHAQRLIDKVAYPTFLNTLSPGSIDDVVYAEVMGNLLKNGASPATVLLFDSGPAGSGTWASGTRHRTLESSDIVLSEPTPSVAGYQSEKMYTFALGHNVPESQKRGAQVVYEAYQLLMHELKAGKELSPIVERCDAYVRSKGYPGCTVPIGHWIGSQNHEGPRFTPEGTKGWVLEPNMVMSWHPNLVVPGGVRTTCSTCVLITDKGAEDLSAIKMQPMYYV